MLDQCSDKCGWIAGVIAALSFGTFGVPIKAVKEKVKVDPLVMQSYKSLVCFLTCWFVIPLGEPFKFTPWGIVSGMFWVPGATAGIYGIQNAGLAVSVGTWSSIIVISSFCWGILVFNEGVKNKFHALLASLILILGLIGMSVYSAPVEVKVNKMETLDNKEESSPTNEDETEIIGDLFQLERDNISDKLSVSIEVEDGASSAGGLSIEENGDIELMPLVKNTVVEKPAAKGFDIESSTTKLKEQFTGGKIIKRRKKNEQNQTGKGSTSQIEGSTKEKNLDEKEELIHFFGKFSLTRRQLGLIGAITNGVWGSNNMIPMHYARAKGFYGAGYLISYSVGSMIVTIVLWVMRYSYHLYQLRDFSKAYNALPSFHFQELAGPGSLAGSLYSLGNFCSIITVTALGQGVGFSFVQTSMLFSGLWGIFYFGEVKGTERIFKWMISSFVTLLGILTLSYEHQGSSVH